jgi:hypothetical protein
MIKTHFGHIVLAIAIVLASLVYAWANRYTFHFEGSANVYVFDHWTGKIKHTQSEY